MQEAHGNLQVESIVDDFSELLPELTLGPGGEQLATTRQLTQEDTATITFKQHATLYKVPPGTQLNVLRRSLVFDQEPIDAAVTTMFSCQIPGFASQSRQVPAAPYQGKTAFGGYKAHHCQCISLAVFGASFQSLRHSKKWPSPSLECDGGVLCRYHVICLQGYVDALKAQLQGGATPASRERMASLVRELCSLNLAVAVAQPKQYSEFHVSRLDGDAPAPVEPPMEVWRRCLVPPPPPATPYLPLLFVLSPPLPW